MSERLNQTGSERYNDKALEQEATERNKQLAREREQSAEKERSGAEKESARHEVERAVAEQEKRNKEKAAASPAEKRRDAPVKNTKAVRDAVFKKEMARIQSEMPATKRAFTKVIHNKAVEKVSEVTGATIARPNAILYGSIFAFVLTATIYFWAQHSGYPLSGFETIAAFIVGWLVGMIVDYVRITLSGGRSS